MATEVIDFVAAIDKLLEARLRAYELALATHDYWLCHLLEEGDDAGILRRMKDLSPVPFASAARLQGNFEEVVRHAELGKKYLDLIKLMNENQKFIEGTYPTFFNCTTARLVVLWGSAKERAELTRSSNSK